MAVLDVITKYVLFIFNLVFVIAGLAVVAVGIAMIFGIKKILGELHSNFISIPIFFIIVGVCIFIIAFAGCCGAIKESKCMLIMYAVFMIVLAAAKIYFIVVYKQQLGTLQTSIDTMINNTFVKHGTDGSGKFQAVEFVLQCCGTNGRDSYSKVPVIPGSCCSDPVDQICNPTAHFYPGCIKKVDSYITHYGKIIRISITVLLVIELTGLAFALFLNYRISKKNKGYF